MLGMTGLGPLDNEPDPEFKKEMDKKEESNWVDVTVEEEMGQLYWVFRNDLDDEGGEELSKLIDKFGEDVKEICRKYDVSK